MDEHDIDELPPAGPPDQDTVREDTVREDSPTPDGPAPRGLREPEIDGLVFQNQEQRLLARMFGIEATPPQLEHFEHYRILGELGRGGMGVVYAAHDLELDRKVAIKQLTAKNSSSLRRRFVREAQAMAKLAHPNVVPIYEIGQVGDVPFIVMEYVDGVTLRRWLTDKPRSIAQILEVFEAAGRGLIAAHSKNMVHRDFKPDNVMVGNDGRVRVMDFGLARSDPGQDDTVGGDPEARAGIEMTQAGAIIGTPAYMAPEQLGGRWADAKSDQFAFCVSFYQALYGERPYSGSSIDELLSAITRGEIGDAPMNTKVPATLRGIVARGLQPLPQDRFESMQALLDALQASGLRSGRSAEAAPKYVFVVHQSTDTFAALRVCEGLLDHGVRPWLDIWDLTSHSDAIGQMREALLRAPAVLLCHGPNGFERHELAEALRTRIDADPSSVYRAALPGASLGEHEGIELRNANWTADLADLAQRIGIDGDRASWLADEAQRAGVAHGELCPYRGLEAFREQDARWMFGREHETAELLELVRANQIRFLTVIGASGSGKSSLVMAGVCPALRNGVIDGRGWTIGVLRPGPRPCESLAHALVSLQFTPEPRANPIADALLVAQLRDQMLTHPDTLDRVVRRLALAQRDHHPTAKILLVVDQLEELFTEARLGHDDASPEAMAFIRNVLAATQLDGTLWVMSTLRADFVQRGLEIAELGPALKAGTYFALPPMGEQQLHAAILRPAKRVGFDLDPRLVEKLVVSAAGQAGRLPLLQHVLRELWQRRDDAHRKLPYEVYAETGGLEGAIAAAAERALAGLRAAIGDPAQQLARQVMTRLVHLGEGDAGHTRRRARAAELGREAEIRPVLDAFVRGARVLVASHVDGVDVVEIAHEALLREWTTLVDWLAADRDALRLRQELAKDAEQWRAHNDREYLWGKGRVEEAKRVLGASTVELNDLERAFLDASRRRATGRTWLVRTSVGVVVAGTALVAVALWRNNQEIGAQADELARTTDDLMVTAKAARELLSEQRGLHAGMLFDADRDLEGLRLAVQAVGASAPAWDAPPGAVEGLERTLQMVSLPAQKVLRGHEADVRALVYSPDGRTLVSASLDFTAKVWDAVTGDLLTTLEGHKNYVTSVVYSPDGKYLLTASKDTSARVWDATTGVERFSLDGHDDLVQIATYSPDGAQIATASNDGTAIIWDAHTGSMIEQLRGHTNRILTLAYSPNGDQIATGGSDGTVRIWDAKTGKSLYTLSGHTDTVFQLVYSHDGKQLATASEDETIRIWNPQTGRSLATLEGHTKAVRALCYSPDDARLASAGVDKTTRIWNTATFDPLLTLEGHKDDIYALAYSLDGKQLASAGKDSNIRIWNATTGQHIITLRGHDGTIRALTYSPDGSHIASADEAIRIWNPAIEDTLVTVEGHDDIIKGLAYSPDGKQIATASEDQTAMVWNASTGERLWLLAGHGSPVRLANYSPDGARIATVDDAGTLRIWAAANGQLLRSFEGHAGSILDVTFSTDGSRIATASSDKTARVWNTITDALKPSFTDALKPSFTELGHENQVHAVSFSPDNKRIATASFDKNAKIWNAGTGELLATLTGHEGYVYAVEFSPDGSRVATASKDGTLALWNADTGKALATCKGHDDDVFAVSYAPDGRTIASASFDGTARIWDAETCQQLQVLPGHTGRVYSVVYSRDGKRLATASKDTTARVWDVATGEPIATLTGHDSEVTEVVFSPDGTRVATSSEDHTARMWDIASTKVVFVFETRIGGRQRPDGTLEWHVHPKELTRIGCKRLQAYASPEEYGRVAEVCDGLLGEQ